MDIGLINRVRSMAQLYSLESDIPPHPLTTRSSITIQAQSMGYVPYVFMTLRRETVATTPGWYGIVLEGTIFNNTTVNLSRLDRYENIVGSVQTLVVPLNLILRGGDTMNLSTFDVSIGGTVTYIAYAPVYQMF